MDPQPNQDPITPTPVTPQAPLAPEAQTVPPAQTIVNTQPTQPAKNNKMFKDLSNFSLVRSTKQAFGFYIVWLILLVVTDALVTEILHVTTNNTTNASDLVGKIIVITGSVALAFLVLSSHKTTKKAGYVVLALISGVLAFFLGGLGGLIIPAYLSTRE